MPYYTQDTAVNHPDNNHSANAGTLERQQVNRARRLEPVSEGDEAELTELAVPPPALQNEGSPNPYEKEQRRARSMRSSPPGDDGDAELTELAAPAPVPRPGSADEEAAGPVPTAPLQHEEFTSSQNSSVTKVEEEKASRPDKYLLAYTELCTISWIIFFAILGTLARLGVQAITTYPNAPFPSTVLWANLGGSLFLGFLLEDRRFFRYTVEGNCQPEDHKSEIDKRKKILPLYIGLATGFCGSFTSFSTFITDSFLALANALASPSPTSPYHTIAPQAIHSRNGGYSFMATVGIIIVQTAVSLASLKTGAHIAVAAESFVPGLPTSILHGVLDPLAIPLGWGCWLGAVFLSIWPPHSDWRYRAVFAMVFAPPGAILRFYLSKYLNGRIVGFPLGTFTVNIFGTIIEGMCMDLQHSSTIVAKVSSMNAVPCSVLQGVMLGFCGSATTVSTWVAELNGLRRRHAWIYGLTSVGVALAFQVVIMGSMRWTVGFDQHCSATSA